MKFSLSFNPSTVIISLIVNALFPISLMIVCSCSVLVGCLSGAICFYSLIPLLTSSWHNYEHTSHRRFQCRRRESCILEPCLDDANATTPRLDESCFVESASNIEVARFRGMLVKQSLDSIVLREIAIVPKPNCNILVYTPNTMLASTLNWRQICLPTLRDGSFVPVM